MKIISDEIIKLCETKTIPTLPKVLELSLLYSVEQLRSPQNQADFFDQVELLMLASYPYKCCMGRSKAWYLQMTPILNTIDTILSHILGSLYESIESTVELRTKNLNFFQQIFLRAVNLFDEILRTTSVAHSPSFAISYLEHSISALKYMQDPEYVIKTVLTATRFVIKYKSDIEEIRDKEAFMNLASFTLPYIRLFEQNGYRFGKTFGYYSNLLQQSTSEGFQLETWLQPLRVLPGAAASTQDVLKILENPRNVLTNQSSQNNYKLAGEVFFLNLIKNHSKPGQASIEYLTTAITIGMVVTIKTFFNSKVNLIQDETSSFDIKYLEGVLDSGSELIPLLFQEFNKIKKPEDKVLLLFSLEMILFTSRKLFYHFENEEIKSGSNREKHEKEKKQAITRYIQENSTLLLEPSKTPDTLYSQILNVLDELAFAPTGDKLLGKTAYLSGLKEISVNSLSMKCLLELNKHLKFLLKNDDKLKTPFFTPNVILLINSTVHAFVKKRFESTTLIDYGVSLLPQLSASFLSLNTRNLELLKLSEYLLQKMLNLPRELIAENSLDQLAKNTQLEEVSKEQLACYLYSHIPLSYLQIKLLRDHSRLLKFPEKPKFLIPDDDTILKYFTLSEANSTNTRLKDLFGFLFYFSQANNFEVSLIDKQENEESIKNDSTEESANKIADLMSFYHSSSLLDLRFIYSLLNFFESGTNLPLAKALSRSHYVKNIILEEVLLSSRLFDSYFAIIDSANTKTLFWTTSKEQQFFYAYTQLPILYTDNIDRGSNASEEEKSAAILAKEAEEVKNRFIRLSDILKKNIDRANEEAIEYIVGKSDILRLYMNAYIIEFQIEVLDKSFSPLLEGGQKPTKPAHPHLLAMIDKKGLRFSAEISDFIKKYVLQLIDSEIGALLSKPVWQQFGDKFLVKNIRIDAEDFFAAFNTISNLREHTIQLFGSLPSTLNGLTKKEIEDFGRLNLIASKLARCDIAPEWHEIQNDPRFDVKPIVSSLCKLISFVSGKKDLFSNNCFPEFRLTEKVSSSQVKLQQSLLGFFVSSLTAKKVDNKRNIFEEALNAFSDIFEAQGQELEKGSTLLVSEELQRIQTLLSSVLKTLQALHIIKESLDYEHRSSDLYEIALHKRLLNKILQIVGFLRPYSSEQRNTALQEELCRLVSDIYTWILGLLSYLNRILVDNPDYSTLNPFLESKFSSPSVAVEAFRPIQEAMSQILNNLDLKPFLLIDSAKLNPDLFPRAQDLFAVIKGVIEVFNLEEGKGLEGLIQSEPLEEVALEAKMAVKKVLTLSNNMGYSTATTARESFDYKTDFMPHNLIIKIQIEIWDKFFNVSYISLIHQLAIFSLKVPEFNLQGEIIKFLFSKHAANQDFQKFWAKMNEEAWSIIVALLSGDLDQLDKVSPIFSMKFQHNYVLGVLFNLGLYLKLYEISEQSISEEERLLIGKKVTPDEFYLKVRPTNVFMKILESPLADDSSQSSKPSSLASVNIFEYIHSKPSYLRYKVLCELYETPCDEFSEQQKSSMDLVYDGIKHILSNSQYYDEKIIELESSNLLALMMWDKKYSIRVIEENLLKIILHLTGKAKTEVAPFILDMLIGNQIPYSIRSEIYLKSALLRTASLASLTRFEMIHGLKMVMRADPKTFFSKFKELFDLQRRPKETKKIQEDPNQSKHKRKKKKSDKTSVDYTIVLKSGQDFTILSENGEYIPEYLSKAIQGTSKTILELLIQQIVTSNEELYIQTGLAHQGMFKNIPVDKEEQWVEKIKSYSESIVLLSILLRKYPELRLFAAEHKVETRIFEATSFSFKKLDKLQEMTFLEYLIHVIETSSYEIHGSLLTSFFGYNLPAFTIRCGDQELSSHEYFSEKVAQSCLKALNVIAEAVDTIEEIQLEYLLLVYPSIIRETLRNTCVSSTFQFEFNNRILSELQSIASRLATSKISPPQLLLLNRLINFQVIAQNEQAFAKLDPDIMNIFFKPKKHSFTKAQHLILRFFQHHERDYKDLNVYSHQTHSFEKHKEVLLAKQPQLTQEKLEKSINEAVRFEKDQNKRSLLTRAVLEAKQTDFEYIHYMGSACNAERLKFYNEWNEKAEKRSDQMNNAFLFFVRLLRNNQVTNLGYAKRIESSGTQENVSKIKKDFGIEFKRNIETTMNKSIRFIQDLIIEPNDLIPVTLEQIGEIYAMHNKRDPNSKETTKTLCKSIKEKKTVRTKCDRGSDSDSSDNQDSETNKDIIALPPIRFQEYRNQNNIFRGLSESKLQKMKRNISLELARILEKKLLDFFNQSLEQQKRIQESCFYKPDPELNLFITKLKTIHEKMVALMILDPVYVGLLSKTYQKVRSNCFSYLLDEEVKEIWIGESYSRSESESDHESGSRSYTNNDSSLSDDASGSEIEDAEEEEKSHEAGSEKSRSIKREDSQEQLDQKGLKTKKGDASEIQEQRDHSIESDEEKNSSESMNREKEPKNHKKMSSTRERKTEENDIFLHLAQVNAEPVSVLANENFDGILHKRTKITSLYHNINDDILDDLCLIDWKGKSIEKLKKSVEDSTKMNLITCMYHMEKLNDMRLSLHTASYHFIESFMTTYLISNIDDLPHDNTLATESRKSANSFVLYFSLLLNLSTNPINEIRIFDCILTLASFDPTNSEALKIFNEHFGTKLTTNDFQGHLNSFMIKASEIIKRYYNSTSNEKNCLQLPNFDKLIASVEKIHGISPLKKRLAQLYPDLNQSPHNFLDGFLSKALSNVGLTTKTIILVAESVLLLRDIGEMLNPYSSEIERATNAIEKVIELLSIVDQTSLLNLKLNTAISDCLENEEIFRRFLDLIRSNCSIDTLERVASEAALFVGLLKTATNDPNQIFKILSYGSAISTDRLVLKFRYTVYFFAKQCRNLMEQLKNAGFIPTQKDYQLCTHLVREIAVVLEIKTIKVLFLHLVQAFELLESIRKTSPQIESKLKDLECLFDIILDIYGIFKAHAELQDKSQDIKFFLERNQDNTENKSKSRVKFERVATKSDDDFQDGLDMKIPSFDRSFSQMKESGKVKIDELFLRLSQKAKQTIQTIKTPQSLVAKLTDGDDISSDGDEEDDLLDTSDIRDLDIFKEYPWLLSLEAKRNLLYSELLLEMIAQQNLDRSGGSTDGEFKMRIRRTHIVVDTKKNFDKVLKKFKGKKLTRINFRVQFKGEDGIDQGGLTNEWLSLVSKELANPSYGLFKTVENGVNIQPNPNSWIVPNHLSYFKLTGLIVGFAVCHKKFLPFNFIRSFLKLILNKGISHLDLNDVDQELMRSLDWMLQNSIEGVLEQDFNYEYEAFDRDIKSNSLNPTKILDL